MRSQTASFRPLRQTHLQQPSKHSRAFLWLEGTFAPPVSRNCFAHPGVGRQLRGGRAVQLKLRRLMASHTVASASVETAEGREAPQESEEGANLVVLTTLGCPYCRKTKQALSEAGLKYGAYDMSTNLAALKRVKETTGRNSVPQVSSYDEKILTSSMHIVCAVCIEYRKTFDLTLQPLSVIALCHSQRPITHQLQ